MKFLLHLSKDSSRNLSILSIRLSKPYTLSSIITMQLRLGKLLGEYQVLMSSILNTASHKATSEIYGKELFLCSEIADFKSDACTDLWFPLSLVPSLLAFYQTYSAPQVVDDPTLILIQNVIFWPYKM